MDYKTIWISKQYELQNNMDYKIIWITILFTNQYGYQHHNIYSLQNKMIVQFLPHPPFTQLPSMQFLLCLSQ